LADNKEAIQEKGEGNTSALEEEISGEQCTSDDEGDINDSSDSDSD
jgi:hypothetical protein